MRNIGIQVLLGISVLLANSSVFAQQGISKAPRDADISCIQYLIDERDTSLANMTVSWSSSVKEALEARRDAEKASWDIPDYKQRRVAQRKAWSDYGKVLRYANNQKKKERVSAWKKFEHNRKECEGAYSPEMNTGSTYDANL